MPEDSLKKTITNEETAAHCLERAEKARQNPREIYGVAPFGIPSLDAVTGGIGEDHMVVLAARPNVGKSALAGQFARTMARYFVENDIDAWVKIASYEMSAEEYLDRVACGVAGVSSLALKRGNIDDLSFERYKKVLASLAPLPIEYTTAKSTFDEFADFVTRGRPCGVWMLDHVGLLSDITNAGSNQYSTLVAVANKLQRLCMNGYPGICVAHMNRSSDTNKDARPSLANLAGADNFARNANLVLSLYRPNLALKLPEDLKDGPEVAFIDILKNKHGPTPSIKTYWFPERTMFIEPKEESNKPQAHPTPVAKRSVI